MKIRAEEPRPELVIKTAKMTFYAGLEKNKTAAEFIKKLSPESLDVKPCGDGGLKTSEMIWDLPESGDMIECSTGDIVYGPDGCLTFCFEPARIRGVKLAHFYEGRAEELYKELQSDPAVRLSLEWSE